MTLEEIIKVEQNRDNNTITKLYFYKDGNSPWYRAYELSAYYATYYQNNLSENERLHPIRKPSKHLQEGTISVGLRLSSFKKYFPDIDVTSITDNVFTININLNDYDSVTVDNYWDICLKWKEQYELRSKSNNTDIKPNNCNKNIYNSPVSFSGIMKEIIRYDTHNRDENDLRRFIYTLKEMCANLI